ncbi:MAG: PhzF family phenazine biosynthesis protein [Solirubrobacterales bacterium]
MTTLHVLRVFTDANGEHGNPLGVFLDGAAIPADQRQAAAAELGFSETVFLDDLARGELRIFTPEAEFDFAGHPMVGTAWLLAQVGTPPPVLRPPAGEVGLRFDDDMTFITGRPEWAPGAEHVELGEAAEVDALKPIDSGDIFYWAWIDEGEGTVRARCFAPDVGITEDQATGSAVIALCGRVGRPIKVHQGLGSVLVARPLSGGLVEVGGRVVLDEEREWPG